MRYLILMGLLSFSLGSCRQVYLNKQIKGFAPYADGEFYYKIFTQNPTAAKPQVGDEVRIDYQMHRDKELLSSSWAALNPTLVEIPTKDLRNFFTDALQLMGEGDSLVLKITAEKAGKYLGNFARFFEADDWVTFDFKLHRIKSKELLQDELLQNKVYLDSLEQAISHAITTPNSSLMSNLSSANSGLQYRIFDSGKGKQAAVSSMASVHYICFNDKGEVVDKSYSNMIPLDFQIGTPLLIDGFSEGTALLKEGGRVLLVIPPHLAYGSTGSEGKIAPDSVVYFYIELIVVY